jgi:hypothetical protein
MQSMQSSAHKSDTSLRAFHTSNVYACNIYSYRTHAYAFALSQVFHAYRHAGVCMCTCTYATRLQHRTHDKGTSRVTTSRSCVDLIREIGLCGFATLVQTAEMPCLPIGVCVCVCACKGWCLRACILMLINHTQASAHTRVHACTETLLDTYVCTYVRACVCVMCVVLLLLTRDALQPNTPTSVIYIQTCHTVWFACVWACHVMALRLVCF